MTATQRAARSGARRSPQRLRPLAAPALRRLPPPQRRGRLSVAVGLLTAVALLAVVAAHAVLASQQFRLTHLQAQVSNQQALNEELTLKVAQLEAPSRIVSAAEQRLGMVPPPAVGYLVPGQAPAASPASSPSGSASSASNSSPTSPAGTGLRVPAATAPSTPASSASTTTTQPTR